MLHKGECKGENMIRRNKEGPKFFLVITLGFLLFGLMVLSINKTISTEVTSSTMAALTLLFMVILGLYPPKNK